MCSHAIAGTKPAAVRRAAVVQCGRRGLVCWQKAFLNPTAAGSAVGLLFYKTNFALCGLSKSNTCKIRKS